MTQLIAVYGTLKRGGSNEHVLEADNGIFVGAGTTKAKYTMFGGWGFPRVIDSGRPLSNIHVEVYEVDSMDNMDRLEGHPDFFCRKPTRVVLSSGKVVDVWMYFHPHIEESEHTPVQLDGNWRVR